MTATGGCGDSLLFESITQDPFLFNTTDVSNEELLNIRLQEEHVIQTAKLPVKTL